MTFCYTLPKLTSDIKNGVLHVLTYAVNIKKIVLHVLTCQFVTRWAFCYTFEKRERVTEISHNKNLLHEYKTLYMRLCYTCYQCYTFWIENLCARAYDWEAAKKPKIEKIRN